MRDRKKIDEQLKKGLDNVYTTDRGKATEICRLLDIPTSTYSKWVSGTIKSIENDMYEKLFPLIASYMPVQEIKPTPPTPNDSFTAVADLISKVAPGRQIVTGVINISGIQIEKIQSAINESNLTQEQKNELIIKIFS